MSITPTSRFARHPAMAFFVGFPALGVVVLAGVSASLAVPPPNTRPFEIAPIDKTPVDKTPAAAAGKKEPAADEHYVAVTVFGRLVAGVNAIGGETTGTTIVAGNIEMELDLQRKPELLKLARELNGKTAMAKGVLTRVQGVERGDRWVVKTDMLSAVVN